MWAGTPGAVEPTVGNIPGASSYLRCVKAFLVTGNPGSGKSTVVRELASRGFMTIDPDYDPELSYWTGPSGRRVLLADGPADPDADWLRSHRWVWSRSRMAELVAKATGPVFVCGIALNVDEVLDLFEGLFLLSIDEATQEARLVAHDQMHPPGRSEAARQEIRDGRILFEAQMIRLGAHALNGAQPPADIVEELLVFTGSR